MLSNGIEIEYLKLPVAMVAKWGSGIDDPWKNRTRSLAEKARGCAWGNHAAAELNLILMKSVAESDDKFATEETAEHADWNDEGAAKRISAQQ